MATAGVFMLTRHQNVTAFAEDATPMNNKGMLMEGTPFFTEKSLCSNEKGRYCNKRASALITERGNRVCETLKMGNDIFI